MYSNEKINAWRSAKLDFSTGAAVLLDTSMSDIMNLNGHSWALDLEDFFPTSWSCSDQCLAFAIGSFKISKTYNNIQKQGDYRASACD